MTQINHQHLYHTLTWIVYMVRQWNEYLPYSEFEWLKNVDKLDVNSTNKKSDIGYILEVDLEYPRELHELHNDYPLAPEKLVVTNDMFSKYCKEIADKHDIT